MQRSWASVWERLWANVSQAQVSVGAVWAYAGGRRLLRAERGLAGGAFIVFNFTHDAVDGSLPSNTSNTDSARVPANISAAAAYAEMLVHSVELLLDELHHLAEVPQWPGWRVREHPPEVRASPLAPGIGEARVRRKAVF